MRFSQFLREDALELALPTDVRSAIIDKGGKIKCIVNDKIKVIDVDNSKDLLKIKEVV